jgi:hypothetical protein
VASPTRRPPAHRGDPAERADLVNYRRPTAASNWGISWGDLRNDMLPPGLLAQRGKDFRAGWTASRGYQARISRTIFVVSLAWFE